MKAKYTLPLSFLLTLVLLLSFVPQQSVYAQARTSGGVAIFSVLPNRICVGDTLTLTGGASMTYLDEAPDGIAWLPVTNLQIQAALGQVSPDRIINEGEDSYFSFTYKATAPGSETITLILNDGLATTVEHFEVEEKCDYDVFLLETIDFTVDAEGEEFHSLAHVTATGLLNKNRDGSNLFEGDGTWHLEQVVLSKPSHCVEYYMPPLLLNGPFEMEGRLSDAGDTLGVRLKFLPRQGEPLYHGQSVCVEEDGSTGYGWGFIQGGDPALASKIEAAFQSGGGSQYVEMEGAGLDMVRSVGQVDYIARMTLLPR